MGQFLISLILRVYKQQMRTIYGGGRIKLIKKNGGGWIKRGVLR